MRIITILTLFLSIFLLVNCQKDADIELIENKILHLYAYGFDQRACAELNTIMPKAYFRDVDIEPDKFEDVLAKLHDFNSNLGSVKMRNYCSNLECGLSALRESFKCTVEGAALKAQCVVSLIEEGSSGLELEGHIRLLTEVVNDSTALQYVLSNFNNISNDRAKDIIFVSLLKLGSLQVRNFVVSNLVANRDSKVLYKRMIYSLIGYALNPSEKEVLKNELRYILKNRAIYDTDMIVRLKEKTGSEN